MRHHNNTRKFGRETGQRKALLSSLASNMIEHRKIRTTEAKAKTLRPFVERLVSKAKESSLTGARTIATSLASREAEKKLRTLAKRYQARAGGYTRITRLGRIGKRVSEMSRIEFVQ